MTGAVHVEHDGRVAVVTLERPERLNALSTDLGEALVETVRRLDADTSVGCMILRGAGRAFAAGADIAEMAALEFRDVDDTDHFGGWDAFDDFRLPKIAAVHGHALGGGCELAMMCDIILAASSARFGQPEIRLGVIPGMGGTQRLARLVGRTRAMELVLTGRLVDAEEAARIGLATEVVDDHALLPRAMEIASLVAGFSRPAVRAAREAIARADELSLREGLRFERRLFHALFANADRTEGMSAFLEKRAPHFQHR